VKVWLDWCPERGAAYVEPRPMNGGHLDVDRRDPPDGWLTACTTRRALNPEVVVQWVAPHLRCGDSGLRTSTQARDGMNPARHLN